MEKGFNDDELADIMNEIENLEQEFAEDNFSDDHEPNLDEVAQSVAQMASEEEDEFSSHVEGVEHDTDLLHEVASMPVENVIPEQKVEKFDDHQDSHHNIHPISSVEPEMKSNTPQQVKPIQNNHKPAKTAMSFQVEGDMKLDLSFLVSGKEINLHISENGFEIELEGGAKFSLPVHGDVHKAA